MRGLVQPAARWNGPRASPVRSLGPPVTSHSLFKNLMQDRAWNFLAGRMYASRFREAPAKTPGFCVSCINPNLASVPLLVAIS